ncbi:MAG: 1-phosphofructokinase family hexose kinase, partial [bacterium]
MIYTVTLNPALDRTIYIEKLSTEAPSRILREESYAAGKGIDVSRVLLELGFESIAIGFLGGYTGKQIEGLLFNEGINMHFISVRGETRTNIIIHTFEGEEYVLNAEGPMILPDELAAFYDYVKKLPRKPSYVAISGSLPRGISPRIYE